MQASNVTLPSRSGKPPIPTVALLGSFSVTITPFSTASTAFPFLLKTSQAAALASFPWFQVEMTIGFLGSFGVEQERLLKEAVLTAKPLKMVDFKNLRLSAIIQNLSKISKSTL